MTFVTLFQAMNNEALTANGGVTNKSSFSRCLDLFNMIGSSRGKDLTAQFSRAIDENPIIALRMLQWVRDCRGGAGERAMYRQLLTWLAQQPKFEQHARAIFAKTPFLGYWKDVVHLYETIPAFQEQAREMIFIALAGEDGLCAKYMPRKGQVASSLAAHAGLTQKQWRKLVVGMSNTVEQKMCARKWDEIDFSKIPSLAAARYQRAFSRNAESNYAAYIDALEKGETKVNASTLYPYDVLKSATNGNAAVANAQWNALPNYMEGNTERVLPLIDVSGSMCCSAGTSGVSCMDVAISLGLYIAQRNDTVFKDHYMTFESTPSMCKLKSKTIYDMISEVRRAPWGGSTNIQRAFDTLLTSAKKYKVAQDQMPTMIIIFSDMEFDCSWVEGRSVSAYDAARAKYAACGYDLPKIVFWNLNARPGNNPVTIQDTGTASVSGFSPAVLKSILGATDFDPYSIMLETLSSDRYAI